MDYVEQRSADLTFYLFESAAPRGLVRVLAERTLSLQGGRVTLAVIGGSHFLEVEATGTLLCELLACPRPGLEALPCRAETTGTGNWSHQWDREELSYRFDLWRRRYSNEQYEAECARLGVPKPRRLQYSFPGSDEAGSALTCVDWRVKGRQVAVTTYHSFPGELTIVHTRSVIDLAETGSAQ